MPDIGTILEHAIAQIDDPAVAAQLQEFLVAPRLVLRAWDYQADTSVSLLDRGARIQVQDSHRVLRVWLWSHFALGIVA